MIRVIVPYKDAAKWIERCAKSLKQQTGDFEFIDDRTIDYTVINDYTCDIDSKQEIKELERRIPRG